MGLEFKRGSIASLHANFLSICGEEPISVINPKITIRHISPNTGLLVTDVNEGTMTLMAENLYYYNWDISLNADLGIYDIECQATVDEEYLDEDVGEYLEMSYNIRVVN